MLDFQVKISLEEKNFSRCYPTLKVEKIKLGMFWCSNCLVLVETVLIHSILCNLCRITVLT